MRLLLLIAIALAPLLAQAAGQGFEFDHLEGGRIRLQENGKDYFIFQVEAKSLEGKYARANYLHPLLDPDGVIVTEDFPKDHRHHRGIFWSWHQLLLKGKSVSDPWKCQDIEWSKPSNISNQADSQTARLEVTRDWLVPAPDKPGSQLAVMRVKAVIVALPTRKGLRRLDFTLSFRALQKGLTLGGSDDAKGYGGFSPRVRLSDDVEVTGRSGPVTPKKTAVEGRRWINGTRTLDGKQRSVTILVHPSHPGFPLKWILRAKRSMQNPQWPGREPIAISTTQETILRYRLLLHNNLLKPEDIQSEWKNYTGE